MEQTSVLERMASPEEAAVAFRNPEALNVGLIYQDAPTREWARQECERLATRTGRISAPCQAWKIADLSHPDVFAKALLDVARADIVAVAIRDVEQLPLAFYVLLDTWSRHRSRPAGALLALLDVPEDAGPQTRRTASFLRSIARQGRLELLQEARAPNSDRTPRLAA